MPQSRKRKGHKQRLEKRKDKTIAGRNRFANLLRAERQRILDENAPKVLDRPVTAIQQHHQQRTK